MVLTCKECICYDNIADSGKIKCKLFDELINIRKLKKCNELEKYLIKKDVDIDSDNINELVDKIVEGNRDKINNNNSFQLLLDKVSEESNRNNAILKEIVEALKIIQNQMQNIFEYNKINSTKISMLEKDITRIKEYGRYIISLWLIK